MIRTTIMVAAATAALAGCGGSPDEISGGELVPLSATPTYEAGMNVPYARDVGAPQNTEVLGDGLGFDVGQDYPEPENP